MVQATQTILLADNDAQYLRTAKEFFEVEGYRVRTAEDPTEARRALQSEPVDIAVLDLRLRDNDDDKDLSGLEVAAEVSPQIPKIVLTLYPRWQDVREAYSPSHNGGPPAVGYIAKEEGLEALLRTVRLALLPDSAMRNNLLQAFNVSAPVALRNRLSEIEVEEATARLRRAYEGTSAELRGHRDRESARASQLHAWGLVASIFGIALFFVACGFVLTGSMTGAVLTTIGGGVANVVRLLFSRREDAAHKRVDHYYKQLVEPSRVLTMLTICESMESAEGRDAYKKKIIDHLLDGK